MPDPTHLRYRVGAKSVWRVGYGAMQLAGDGVFGPPRDRDEAIAVLRAAVDAGVDHIDTAQYYGPGVVNQLIREALFPYPNELALVSKVAARRDDVGAVLAYDDPDQLRVGIEDNLATLGVEQLTAVNLRVMDKAAPDDRFVDQLGALVAARDEGLIAGIGISNVTLRHLSRAVEVNDIVCVQNAYNLADRSSAAVLNECTARGIEASRVRCTPLFV
jgi:pyridoxine 4-dehydrogenase